MNLDSHEPVPRVVTDGKDRRERNKTSPKACLTLGQS